MEPKLCNKCKAKEQKQQSDKPKKPKVKKAHLLMDGDAVFKVVGSLKKANELNTENKYTVKSIVIE